MSFYRNHPHETLASHRHNPYDPRLMDKLLRLLEENARLTPATLAKRLKRTEKQVRQHMKELEDKGVILAYQAVIDEEKARRDAVKAVIEVKLAPERGGGFDRLAMRIAQYDEVTSCFLMSGGSYDLLVFIEGKTLKEVAQFVSEKLSTIRGVLSTATRFNLKVYKDHRVLRAHAEDEERLRVSP